MNTLEQMLAEVWNTARLAPTRLYVPYPLAEYAMRRSLSKRAVRRWRGRVKAAKPT